MVKFRWDSGGVAMYILYFDICAAIVLMAVAFSAIIRKMTRGTANKIFMTLLVTVLLADLFDLWYVTMNIHEDSLSYAGYLVMWATCTGYYLFHSLTVVVYLLYLISLCDTWHKLKKNRWFVMLTSVPTVINLVAVITNVFTKKIFYIDENYHYVRGTHIYIVYACVFVNMLICLACLIQYRKLFPKDKFVALFSMIPIELCAVVIQWSYPNLMIEMFANAVALFLVGTVAQRPEEMLDSVTSLGKFDAYAVNMKKNFANEKHVISIMINVSNFLTLQKILNFDGSNEMLQRIAQGLNTIDKELKTGAELYYLDSGRFRYVIDEGHSHLVNEAAESINSYMKQSMKIGGLELNLVTYIFVARCPEEIRDFKTLIQVGGILHERYSYSGQVMYASDMVEQDSLELSGKLNEIIDNAIANKRFEVYYQPIYFAEKGKFVSAEALLRLKDDQYGFISPEIFIPAAERSGAIHKIGDFVMEEVCHFIASEDFKKLGMEYIEVNLSVAQCMQPDLAEKILEIMKRYGVPTDKINLEITETAANYAQDILMSNVRKLYSNGVKFSLDDYGTGYSNIERITLLPFALVKLDKTFVGSESDAKKCSIVQNTIKMLKDIDMHIVIEGVETKQDLHRFTELKCDYIQGYYFSKPIPENEFVSFVMKRNAAV